MHPPARRAGNARPRAARGDQAPLAAFSRRAAARRSASASATVLGEDTVASEGARPLSLRLRWLLTHLATLWPLEDE